MWEWVVTFSGPFAEVFAPGRTRYATVRCPSAGLLAKANTGK